MTASTTTMVQALAAAHAAVEATELVIELDARSRLQALEIFEGHAQERAELRAAGVSEERVLALYPFSIEQAINGVIAAIEQRGLDHLDGTEAWHTLDRFNYEAKSELPLELQTEMVNDFMDSLGEAGYYARLGKAVRIHLTKGVDAAARDNGVNRALLYACWMMTHLQQVPRDQRFKTMNYFSLVMQWVFPDMTAETL